MRTKRNISGAARPTIERVDELQNQERSDRGYGGVRKLFVDHQLSMRQQFEFDARRPTGEMLWGGRRGWQFRRLHQSMECRDVPAERFEQVPRAPGPR